MAIENKKVKNENADKNLVIPFSNDDYPKGFYHNHNDPMVITTTVHNYFIKRILVNQGSLVDILYNAIAANMNIKRRDLTTYCKNLIGFFRKLVSIKGTKN